MNLSILIPVLNEAESIKQLYTELDAKLSQLTLTAELIFIDDGSIDDTPLCLKQIASRDQRVIWIQHPRTFGKSACYSAGFSAAHGEIIVTMDGDLQDDPEELPGMLDALDSGTDIVIGWKQNRLRNEFGKAIPSKIFNWLLSRTFSINLHDSNCGYRAMRHEVAESLMLYGGYYRFIPEIAHAKGYRVKEIPIKHRKRIHGHSKYGVGRFWTSVFDMLALRFSLSFLDRPLQVFGSTAAIFMLIGGGLELYVLWQKLHGESFQTHLAALVTGIFLMIVGVQILAVGFIAVMIAAHRYGSPAPQAQSGQPRYRNTRNRKQA